jgi:ergothioneine biosynthesis protein EgtB
MTSPELADEVIPRAAMRRRYSDIRQMSEQLAAPLSAEDQCIQSMPDASPTKWHLAHTSWFFETLIADAHAEGYRLFDPQYQYLFNSYYEALGPRHPRPKRGLLSRPPLDAVIAYRHHVDAAMLALLERASDSAWTEIAALVELGLQHEQQHQELLLTDIKHALSWNPLMPCYQAPQPASVSAAPALRWIEFAGGIAQLGHDGDGFCFDNEMPRHDVMLRPYALANRAVTNGEYRAFMADGGYRRPEFWLSDGWALAQAEGWQAPLYWLPDEHDGWQSFTLNGPKLIDDSEPACHVSFYEAAAYASWAGCRLPTEPEWEVAAARHAAGHRFDAMRPHPRPAPEAPGLTQLLDDVWEWTRSAYDPYPGFRAPAGALGEYNGKFMVGQIVLRGGSCATPPGHARVTYRNFFPPQARWQFSGIRLARDI